MNFAKIAALLHTMDNQIDKAEEAARKAEEKAKSLSLKRDCIAAAAEIAANPDALSRFEELRACHMPPITHPQYLDHVIVVAGPGVSILSFECGCTCRGPQFEAVAEALDTLREKGFLD